MGGSGGQFSPTVNEARDLTSLSEGKLSDNVVEIMITCLEVNID